MGGGGSGFWVVGVGTGRSAGGGGVRAGTGSLFFLSGLGMVSGPEKTSAPGYFLARSSAL